VSVALETYISWLIKSPLYGLRLRALPPPPQEPEEYLEVLRDLLCPNADELRLFVEL